MNKPRRYIGSKCKTCNVVTSALVSDDDMRAAQMFDGWPDTNPAPTNGFRRVGGDNHILCRGGCGKTRRAKLVKGTFSTVHKCSAKCLASTGFVCDCSCAGANHGANSSAL